MSNPSNLAELLAHVREFLQAAYSDVRGPVSLSIHFGGQALELPVPMVELDPELLAGLGHLDADAA